MALARGGWHYQREIQSMSSMHTFPPPALAAAALGLIALPFSAAASAMLLMSAGLGFIIHADYVLRTRRTRLPRRAPAPVAEVAAFPVGSETHRLAA
jgi:hypothetical protein